MNVRCPTFRSNRAFIPLMRELVPPWTGQMFGDLLLVVFVSMEHYIRVSFFPCFGGIAMLAKMTSKNQITLPKAAIKQVAAAQYFEVEAKDGRIILTPVRLQKADAVRQKLASMGIGEEDVADAITWARRRE